MWPSQFWAVLQGLPRYLYLKQSQKCWVLAFLLQALQQQNAHTVLRIASLPSHHGYYTHLSVLFPTSIALFNVFFFLIGNNVSLMFYSSCVYMRLENWIFSSFIFFFFVFNHRMRTTVSATRRLTTRQKCSTESSRTCRFVEL